MNSCQLAEDAAGAGDFEAALAWLQMVEAVDGSLLAEWRYVPGGFDQGRHGASPTGGGAAPPDETDAPAGEKGGRESRGRATRRALEAGGGNYGRPTRGGYGCSCPARVVRWRLTLEDARLR